MSTIRLNLFIIRIHLSNSHFRLPSVKVYRYIMGNEYWGLGIRLVFISIYLVAYTYTCLGARSNITTVACSKQEMLALLKFKNSVKDKNDMLSSWVGIDCCRWERVQCESGTGYVQGLYLRSGVPVDVFPTDFLAGKEVSNSLGELKHLKYLDLSGNDFQGSRIPEFIGSLKQLQYLNLSHSVFSGNIPHHIGNLSNLKVLDLSLKENYQYRLMADDMSWISSLSSLEYLDLSYVFLSGAKNSDMVLHIIPSLVILSLSGCGLSNADLIPLLNSSSTLANIKYLNLGFNYFYGQVPYVFQNMTSLQFLDLSYFNFSLAWNSTNLLSMIPSLLELHLSYCSLEGRIPSVLTNMTSLRVLDLSWNRLNSSFPVLPNLLELDLSYNEFKEIEDVGIWRQCHLKQLTLKHNRFLMEFTDPPINMSKCSQYSMERLYLETSLNGTIPESLGRMANLRGLHLRGNRLTGPIPASLERLRLLRVLDLSYNQLMVPIPESLASLRLLEGLDLSSNQLIGPIPNFPKKLTVLDLSFNRLNGSIPESIGRLASLKLLGLHSNQLTGSIPESIGRLESLTSLFLGYNLLAGPIPESVGKLVSLQIFSVSGNSLNGTIPVSIGQLMNIRILSVSSNSLEGVVSESHLDNLSMLKNLDLGYNRNLTFGVSREWIPASQLTSVELASCKIVNGRFPEWLRSQRKLERLVLDNTTISGPLPTWLRKLPIIPLLSLVGNKLTGPLTNLPNGGTVNLYTNENMGLFLQDNLFNDSISRSLCRPDLEFLILGNNRLTGKIPNCLEDLQNLLYMVFSSNKLSGVIPSFLGRMSKLRWLNLSNNSFIGELPQELGNLDSLEVLDLGENSFCGNVPGLIEERNSSLRILRLHKNNFTGRIPPSLCKHSNLQVLDVAHNSLTGSIPDCVAELYGMVWNNQTDIDLFFSGVVNEVFNGVVLKYERTLKFLINMDFSSNKLVGEIPSEIVELHALVGLNLSNNHLIGGIPNDIGNMRSLISLDLSGNKLTGKIPLSISDMHFLSHLNLSHNNLSGRIPTGNQLQTLIDPSIYDGNKDLCGAPLPKNCSKDEGPTTQPKTNYKRAHGLNKVWLYSLDILGGFATGFWGVIGVLVFKKQWRHKLFMFAESLSDKIYVAVMVRITKMRRVTQANTI